MPIDNAQDWQKPSEFSPIEFEPVDFSGSGMVYRQQPRDAGVPDDATYVPQPVDVSAISLPNELNALLELLAENVHEVWASGRIAEGWRYGERRDEAVKRHPCLVPYVDLPESEKEYDRRTAMATLQTIMALGFAIVPASSLEQPSADDGTDNLWSSALPFPDLAETVVEGSTDVASVLSAAASVVSSEYSTPETSLAEAVIAETEPEQLPPAPAVSVVSDAWRDATTAGLEFFWAHMHYGGNIRFVGHSWKDGGFYCDDTGRPIRDHKGNTVATFTVEPLDPNNPEHTEAVDVWWG